MKMSDIFGLFLSVTLLNSTVCAKNFLSRRRNTETNFSVNR